MEMDTGRHKLDKSSCDDILKPYRRKNKHAHIERERHRETK